MTEMFKILLPALRSLFFIFAMCIMMIAIIITFKTDVEFSWKLIPFVVLSTGFLLMFSTWVALSAAVRVFLWNKDEAFIAFVEIGIWHMFAATVCYLGNNSLKGLTGFTPLELLGTFSAGFFIFITVFCGLILLERWLHNLLTPKSQR